MGIRLTLVFLIVGCVWFAGCASNPAKAMRVASPDRLGQNANSRALSLDGKAFTGVFYWDSGLAKLLRYRMTISFQDGMLSYRFAYNLLNSDPDYKPVPYTTTTDENGNLLFRAHSGGQEKNYTDMSGVYDGKRLSNVKILWNEGGETRTFRFKPKK